MVTKKKFIQVEESYIKQIHSEVCNEWKQKIETKFPALFPLKYISLNKKFVTSSGDKCILIRNLFDNKKVILIYQNGEEIIDVTEFLTNNKITKSDMSNKIYETFVKYL